VAGIQIGETFPRIARMADKCVFIRSMVGATGGHDAVQCMSGWTTRDMKELGGRPSLGAVAARVQGPVDSSVPPFVGLAAKTGHMPWADPGTPGFLGTAYAAFKPDGQGMSDMTLKGMTLDQLGDRKRLLKSFDDLRRDVDASGQMKGMDALTERAMNVLTSSKLKDALDLSQESAKVRERYGDGKPYKFQYDGAPTVNDHLLIARRLVEAGARCVTLSFGRWDSHGKNFDLVRDHGAKLDQALTALIEDLDGRGMLNDVAIVCWGEFGRTPRINKNAGRDHWGPSFTVLLGGGGLKGGRVVGASDARAERPATDPYGPEDLFFTMFKQLGIDPKEEFRTPDGRPVAMVNNGKLIAELV
jgi:hypothetical protein